MNLLLLSLIIPAVIIVAFLLYLKRKFTIKSWNLLMQSFILGIFSILILVVLDQFAHYMEWDVLRNLKRTGFYSFVVVGFGSELGKFVVLRYIFLPKKNFHGPIDGVIYSSMISMGFTLLALPLFVSGIFSSPVKLPFVLLYPIANLAFAAITGFFTGLGKLRRNKLIDSISGLGTATFLHGFFYFINLTDEYTIYFLYGLGTLFIATILLLKARNLKLEEPAR
ncbi:MAG TPA: PrsW family glutamic-type intramembrane protease [Bacteroidales bacterium]|nr:PrsW family glutamic-type intramembrane protease [Bacteroidales bacterium]